MPSCSRVVLDTNVLISRPLVAGSIPSEAVRKARRQGVVLVSEATMTELADVLGRAKLNRYVSVEDRKQFLRHLARTVEFVPTIRLIHECCDPKDDKFLEVALNGRADLIISGDRDLLALHPWRGIPILSPKTYVNQ